MDSVLGSIVEALRARGVEQPVIDAGLETSRLTGSSLTDVLLSRQVLTVFEVASAVADAYGLEAVELTGTTVDPAVMRRTPLVLARRHQMISISADAGVVTVAVVDPGDVIGLDDIRAATGATVVPVVVTQDELTRLLERYARDSADLSEAAAQMVAEDTSNARLTGQADDTPVVRYVTALLERAITSRGSDIHLEPSEFDLKVRLRIDGVLHAVDTVPQGIQSALISRFKIMSGLDITERRIPQNGRITMEIGTRSVDLRVATLPTVWGEKVVLRILDTGGVTLDLRKLGFTEHNYARFSASFSKAHGMVLVTGPTGSGKSTTLYATLTQIARPEVNVITVEDPVEYRIDGINQVQVNPKAGLDFDVVLPAILRSDPDVILIGEIRDRTTAQLAIEAALTGHLVLSTLHTNDSPSAVTRLVEMGIEPFLVGSSLDAVLAQRLARRLCEWCKESYEPTDAELSGARWPFEDLLRPATLWRAKGCRSCVDTGYRGRLAVNEVMPVSEGIERLAVERAPSTELAKLARAEGLVSLRDDGLRKASEGLTTIEEILRITV